MLTAKEKKGTTLKFLSENTVRKCTFGKEIIEGVLRANGFDGLYHPDPDMECGCTLNDLAPCQAGNMIPGECKPGYHVPGTDGDIGPRLVQIEGGAA